MTTILLILTGSVILIGYMDRDLFCSSMDLIETIQNPTPFCQLSGAYIVSIPDPKPTPVRIAFSILHVILEAIYAPDEVWGRDYSI